MITSAAVKIFDRRQSKEVIIPCHRHADAFQILKDFGYRKNIDYEEIAQGFLTEKGVFLNRVAARSEAIIHDQYKPCYPDENFMELYSEDLW